MVVDAKLVISKAFGLDTKIKCRLKLAKFQAGLPKGSEC